MKYLNRRPRPVSLKKLVQHLRREHPSWTPAQVEACAQEWVVIQEMLDQEDLNRDRSFYRKHRVWEDPYRALLHQARQKKPGKIQANGPKNG